MSSGSVLSFIPHKSLTYWNHMLPMQRLHRERSRQHLSELDRGCTESAELRFQDVHLVEVLNLLGRSCAELLVAVVKVSLVLLKLLRSMNLWGQDLSPYWLMLIRFRHAVKRRVAVGREVS